MECPNCGCELLHSDSFGSMDYITRGDRNGKRGDIFECRNSDGFESKEDAESFLLHKGMKLEDFDAKSWEDLSCENEQGNGFYYNYVGNSNLREGYPC